MLLASHSITFVFEDGRVARVDANADETVLDAALGEELWLMHDCREGACATCQARAVSGEYVLSEAGKDTLSEADISLGGVLTCQMYARGDCVVELPYVSTIAFAPEPEWRTARLIGVEQVSSTVARIDLASSDAQPLTFLPGQYVHMEVPGTRQQRSYSFANAPGAIVQTFYVRLLKGGAMSNYVLERARPGDLVPITGPFGRFYLRPPQRPILMVAGGTGIAPMLSMLEQLALSGNLDTRVRLLYGANSGFELFAIEQLASYRSRGLKLSYETIATMSETGWSGRVGLVTDLLENQDAHSAGDIYLCGPPPMVLSAQEWLQRHGVAANCIHSEQFVPTTAPR